MINAVAERKSGVEMKKKTREKKIRTVSSVLQASRTFLIRHEPILRQHHSHMHPFSVGAERDAPETCTFISPAPSSFHTIAHIVHFKIVCPPFLSYTYMSIKMVCPVRCLIDFVPGAKRPHPLFQPRSLSRAGLIVCNPDEPSHHWNEKYSNCHWRLQIFQRSLPCPESRVSKIKKSNLIKKKMRN